MTKGVSTAVFRVQGRDGRGPWRPGFSERWSDLDFAEGMTALPTWMDEFGLGVLTRVPFGYETGSGVLTPEGILPWFSDTERKRLLALDFRLVRMNVDLILGESPHQVFFARRAPLRVGAVEVFWPVRADCGLRKTAQ